MKEIKIGDVIYSNTNEWGLIENNKYEVLDINKETGEPLIKDENGNIDFYGKWWFYKI